MLWYQNWKHTIEIRRGTFKESEVLYGHAGSIGMKVSVKTRQDQSRVRIRVRIRVSIRVRFNRLRSGLGYV